MFNTSQVIFDQFIPKKIFFFIIIVFYSGLDERLGTNLLLICSETFDQIEVRHLGPLELEWGFTSVKKLPGSNDTFVALKVREVSAKMLRLFFPPYGPILKKRFLVSPRKQESLPLIWMERC